MIYTDEDDEFNRIERESKLRMEAVYQEVQKLNKAMEREYMRPWVGLTEEEIRLQWSEFWEAKCHPWAIEFARAIEAKLKEKNT
jgi:hypothetical protein